ncbi:MAG: Eco57I restriction-modification methylase domain-containing protein, partial [Flavobacteriaceae bacterium]|nr:Eco57I restriction-modification methylase domain-containing protein [Flavobacteriaceae bacterium]
LESKDVTKDIFLQETHTRVLGLLKQVDYLSQKYHVVVANPPYMGGKGMSDRLKKYLSDNYNDVKTDLFSAFMVRNTYLTLPKGQLGFMTPFVWMFISSYEKLREFIINQKTITSLVQLEYSGFDGATVPICTFTLENAHNPEFLGGYIKLSDFKGSENQAPKTLEAIKNKNCGWFYRRLSNDFLKIPSNPIVYWTKDSSYSSFINNPQMQSYSMPRQGLTTTDNNRFIRNWNEVSIAEIGFNKYSINQASDSQLRWFPIDKGGGYRKWYGNNTAIVNWQDNGREIKENIVLKYPYLNGNPDFVAKNSKYYFKPGVTWGKITSSSFSCRFTNEGFIFSDAGSKIPTDNIEDAINITAYLNSVVAIHFLSMLSPTLNFEQGTLAAIPYNPNIIFYKSDSIVKLAKQDWDSYETSWDFTTLTLLQKEYKKSSLEESYKTLRAFWQTQVDTMKQLEEENNDIFIKAYGL